MSALDRKLLRDLWHIRGQALAIALVIACGVALVVMSFGTLQSLTETRDAYYERYRFADVFASVKRAPERLLWKIRSIPGVARAETRVVSEVTLDVPGMDEPVTGRMLSLPDIGRPVLNDLALRRGRLLVPGRADEVVLNEAFADAHRLFPGDRLAAIINGRKRTLTIVGIALSPEYIYAIGRGVLVPDDRRFGLLWMGRDALEAAYDLDGAFNDVSLALERSASEEEVIARLDDLLEPYGGVGAFGRDDQISHSFLQGELDQLSSIGTIIPPIFLGVAAFLLNIVVSRIIETEREQIGLFKALGYSDLEVGWHYLKFVLVLVATGVLLGIAVGAWLGRGVTELYADFYRFPFLHYRADPAVFIAAVLAALASAFVATLGVVRRAVRLPPAVAMAPPTPALYTRTLVERLGVMPWLSEPSRMILRHVTRRPVRAGLTTLGIALAVAVLVGSLFAMDSIDHMIHVQYFQTQRQDISITFTEPRPGRVMEDVRHLPGVLRAEPWRLVPARLRAGHRVERVALTGLAPDAVLRRVVDTRLRTVPIPPYGIIINDKLAEVLQVRAGDSLTVEALEGRRPVVRVPVAIVAEEYLGLTAYMNIAVLNRLMGEGDTVSGADLLVDQQGVEALYAKLKATPMSAGIFNRLAAVETIRATLAESMYIILGFYVTFAALIAIGVLYNTARISLSEFGRELASLRVLGFTRDEVSYILLGEFALLTLLALPIGCAIGYGLAWAITTTLDTELYRMPLVVDRATFGSAVAAVVGAAVVSGLMVRRRIDRLDLIAVLKTRE